MNTVSEPADVVTVKLNELVRVRDAIAVLRHYHPRLWQLWTQVAGLIQRLEPQLKKELQK